MPAPLPNEVEALRAIIAAQAAELEAERRRREASETELAAAKAGLVAKALEMEKLKIQLARLRRMQFGSSSEKIAREIEQLELSLEDLEATTAAEATMAGAELLPTALPEAPEARARAGRRKLPEHLPRTEIVHAPHDTCPSCGSTLRKVGEDVTEVLDYIPARFTVIRHVRPALSCRCCEGMVQAPMPSLPIERGLPSAGLLAHVLIAKYCDHLPLYRQSAIYAREGVELERSLLADWVGKAAALMAPLANAIAQHVLAGSVLHADDTPGHLHADGYGGFDALYDGGRIAEVACMAHVRRKFFDEHVETGSPLAAEMLKRIGVLFDIERSLVGLSAEERSLLRQAKARPALDELAAFLDATLLRIPGKGDLAKAIRYARSRWTALTRYVDDGRLELSNNAAERAIRPLAIGRRNWMFAGSDAGGERAAAIYTITQTVKLNGLDPQAYLRDVLDRIADHPINRITDLLPWNIVQMP
ncbi:IS66 family transposase [Nitrospirillum viridazoti CBAmc]|uniref:IS66 family transposase n=1 Tax=Nitrospirillum viridazoti CBAmc TaxID=1441467 RepID=A0A248K1E9_9PROT|nr:IS66 family transposase [Nitrospirillum amazonense]ASG24807.1 IS66 family transposase [Nitrospirillum amazonense CBAmc]